jgi:hypothetical protein
MDIREYVKKAQYLKKKSLGGSNKKINLTWKGK